MITIRDIHCQCLVSSVVDRSIGEGRMASTLLVDFYARQHSAYMHAIARPSVRLSDGWIIEKRLKLGLWNFHHTVAPSL